MVRFRSVLALLMLAAARPAFAQSTGTISGIVTDQQQAAIEGAEVKLVDTKTAIPTVSLTNSSGRYVFLNLNSGVYDMIVAKPGFVTSRIANQSVEVGRALTLDLTLGVGGTTTTIEVQAGAGAELQTMNATIGSTVRGDQLILLPNTSRDVSSLITLNVGVTPNGSVAGAVNDQNSFKLDGGNNTSDMDGNQTIYTPSFASTGAPTGVMPTPVESIEEFKLSTTNHTADFNGAAGGQVQLVTKRGTNQIHGSAYDYYFASNVWAANNWKNNHTASGKLAYTPLPKTHFNRFGFSLGGPVVKKEILGGKTYLFGMYEGYRFPNTTTFERQTPTPLLRLGVVQLPDAGGVYRKYNLNPFPVTYQGETINPAVCGAGPCDPRGIGLNSVVTQIWKQMPLPNDPQFGDTYNTQGYLTTLRLPQKSNFAVGRLDHDFGAKNRFYSSYRYYNYSQLANTQVDIGGVLPGAKFGEATAYAPRPQKPWFLVGSLNTTLNSAMTNNFNFSYLRNFWQWGTAGAPPQIAGLGGALSLGPDSAASLIPYNVNTQSVRQRFWNGHDYTFRDDVSWLKGKHLIQFGGEFQRNVDGHQRNDNGQGIMSSFVYQSNDGAGVANTTYVPAGLPAAQLSNWRSYYNQVLGIISQPQVMYTRAGKNLELQPVGTELFTNVVIPSYNIYFSDTWRVKPELTITYGTGYQVEMPPYETEGKQVELVDPGGNQLNFADYFDQRQSQALAGKVYNPAIGFATIQNVKGGNTKYPYNPFYGGLSPRLAVAWTPKFSGGILGSIFGDGKTVIRGGYSRLYGRLNGVGQVLIPLLGTGLAQAVSCIGPRRDGTCPNAVGGVDPTSAFRIGTDGMTAPLPAVSRTLAQPFFPGVGGNAAAADGTVLDPATKPNRSDQYNFTVQREVGRRLIMEVGYIGRKINNEFQQVNMNAVPWMTTLGGQSFANAFANTYFALAGGSNPAPQPFFENALGGVGSAFCAGQPSCTAAVVATNRTNITSTQVFTLWNNLDRANGWTLGRTMLNSSPSQATAVFVNRSNGYGNYNAGFFSMTLRDWRGLTARSNFTYSRSLGTGAVAQATSSFTALNPWDLKSMYGRQAFDIPLVYNLSMYYQPKFFDKARGVAKHLLGGWNIAPLFTAQSGAPLRVSMGSNCQSFGEVNCSSGSTYENAVLVTKFTGGNSLHYNVDVPSGAGINGNASRGGSGLNIFEDPNKTYAQFRRLVLGYDTSGGGFGVARGFPLWNLDASIVKDIHASERIKAQLSFQFNNILNHFQPADPAVNYDSPQAFGVVTTNAGVARQVQFGLRIAF